MQGWYIRVDGQISGPVSNQELKELLERQDFKQSAYIRKWNSRRWLPASKVKSKSQPEAPAPTPVPENHDLGVCQESSTEEANPEEKGDDFGAAIDSVNEMNEFEELENLPVRPIQSTKISKPVKETSIQRYPNLFKYLKMLEVFALVLFWVYVLIGGGGLVYYVLHWVLSGFSPNEIPVVVVCVAVFILYSLAGWLLYVLNMAAMEFLRVVIDIESNTREAATQEA